MTPEISRVSGDTEAKHRFVRDTLAQLSTVRDVAVFSTAMLNSMIPTDKVALAVVEGGILRSVSTIGRRVFMDLSLEQPSINSRAFRTGKTQLVNDTRLDPDYFPGEGSESLTMFSELCIPLILSGRVLGTVNFECRKPGRFTEEDSRAAEAFAAEIAGALHRVMGEKREKGRQVQSVTKARSPLDRYHDLLDAVYEGEIVMNKILNRVAIQWKPGKQLIEDLVQKGYLVRKQTTAKRYAYFISDEGIKALKTYKDIIGKLGAQRPPDK